MVSAAGAQPSPALVTDELAFAAGMQAALSDGQVLLAAWAREAASPWERDPKSDLSIMADEKVGAQFSQADGPSLVPRSRPVGADSHSLSCTVANREHLSPSAPPQGTADASAALEPEATEPPVPTECVDSSSHSTSPPSRRRRLSSRSASPLRRKPRRRRRARRSPVYDQRAPSSRSLAASMSPSSSESSRVYAPTSPAVSPKPGCFNFRLTSEAVAFSLESNYPSRRLASPTREITPPPLRHRSCRSLSSAQRAAGLD